MGEIPRTAGGCPAGSRWGVPYQELGLGRVELLLRLLDREPARAVDLGKRLHTAAARRPLHLERVAGDGLGVAIPLRGARGDALAALLLDGAELDELGAGREGG